MVVGNQNNAMRFEDGVGSYCGAFRFLEEKKKVANKTSLVQFQWTAMFDLSGPCLGH